MVLEATFKVGESAIHHHSQPSSQWIDYIDCDKIPNIGTYLFITQIIINRSPSSRHVQLAAKLLNQESNISISIHRPSKTNLKPFVSSMVDLATDLYYRNEYAKKLKDSLSDFETCWNRETFQQFAQSWSKFTYHYLDRQINECKI